MGGEGGSGEQAKKGRVRGGASVEELRAEVARCEARLRRVERLTACGSWEMVLPDGPVRWSEEMYRILGLRRGLTVPSVEAYNAAVHPDDLARVQGEFAEVLRGAPPPDFEHRIARPDGEVRNVMLRAEVALDAATGTRTLTGTCQDITDYQNAQRASREGEQRYRNLVEASPDVIFVLERDEIVFVNEAGQRVLRGEGPEEIIGRSALHFFHPDDHEAIRGSVERLRESPRRVLLDAERLVALDGTEVDVEVAAASFYVADQMAVQVACRDITARRRSEALRMRAAELELQSQRSEEASRLKDEFVANMSHELRTPLNAIIGFAELLYDGEVPHEEQRKEFLGDILSSGRHLLRLINDVLDLAKVDSGRVDLRPESIDLGEAAKEVCSVLRGVAAEKGMRVELEVDGALGGVYLDPARFRQVLYNYLSNALKFAHEGGRITVRLLPEGQSMLRLEVEDDGPGISAEDIARLFVEFQQLEASATKRHQGTGLGLALTKRIVEAQGGAVGVRSSVGEGSVFWASLPRRAEGAVG